MKKITFSKPIKGEKWETSDTYILPDGNIVDKKPEAMTHLFENKLVYKDDPRITLRGKLDSFQAELIHIIYKSQTLPCSKHIPFQLKELLNYARIIMKHEILNTEMPVQNLLSWTYEEIRARSHNTNQYYNLDQMVLIDESFSEIIILLNILRAKIREIELTAVRCYRRNDEITRNDLVTALNRMSSCFHILIYQELAHEIMQ